MSPNSDLVLYLERKEVINQFLINRWWIPSPMSPMQLGFFDTNYNDFKLTCCVFITGSYWSDSMNDSCVLIVTHRWFVHLMKSSEPPVSTGTPLIMERSSDFFFFPFSSNWPSFFVKLSMYRMLMLKMQINIIVVLQNHISEHTFSVVTFISAHWLCKVLSKCPV